MLKNLLNFSGNILFYSNILTILLKYKESSLRIIYYHLIDSNNPDYYFNNKSITPQEFERQIVFFKTKYKIISLDEAIERADNDKSLDGYMVITFDDGFVSNYEVVAPILLKHNLVATFFLIGACVDNKHLMWRNKAVVINNKLKRNIYNEIEEQFKIRTNKNKNFLNWSFSEIPMEYKEQILDFIWETTMDLSVGDYLEKHKPYLTTKQVQELSLSGFGFGIHSYSHPRFDRITYECFENEIIKSNEILSTILNKEIISFSYPFGVRAPIEFEERIQEKLPKLRLFLGTKNKLNNYPKSMHRWERDNLEFNFGTSISRLSILPIVRNSIYDF